MSENKKLYVYEAINGDGNHCRSAIEATSKEHALERLASLGVCSVTFTDAIAPNESGQYRMPPSAAPFLNSSQVPFQAQQPPTASALLGELIENAAARQNEHDRLVSRNAELEKENEVVKSKLAKTQALLAYVRADVFGIPPHPDEPRLKVRATERSHLISGEGANYDTARAEVELTVETESDKLRTAAGISARSVEEVVTGTKIDQDADIGVG